jgi:hypothetical protein
MVGQSRSLAKPLEPHAYQRKFADRDGIDWPRPASAPAWLLSCLIQIVES